MNAVYTPEQVELRDLVRRFLASKAPVSATRDLVESNATWDPKVWQQLAEQLDIVALGIPVEYNGQGLGATELSIVVEEMGRVLYGGPYISTAVLAVHLLASTRDTAVCQRWLPRIADGEMTASVVLGQEANERLAATRSESGWHLTGIAPFVADGSTSDLFLVPAADEGGNVRVFAVEAKSSGLTIEPTPILDLTRNYAALTFDGVQGEPLDVADAFDALAKVETLAHLAIAAEQVGGATQILDEAVEYAKLRVQFGRPIGSFQAIKHRCADLFVQIEGARGAAFFAAAMFSSEDPEAAMAASVAKAWCSEAFTAASKAAVQIFGGIGFTWEHDCHLYLRRAKTDELLNGTPAEHRQRIAHLIGL